MAPFHVQMLSGRSAFLVFINCPGGRAATLAYLEKLNLYLSPWALEPAEISSYSSTNHPERMFARRLNPETPQFPAGTILALVRRMMVVDDELRPVSTRITQKVQLRVYRQVPATPSSNRAEFAATQSMYEWVLRRSDLLAAHPAGLLAIRAGEREFQRTGGAQAEPRSDELAGPVVLSTCGRCHSDAGIFSVNSYTQFLSGGVREGSSTGDCSRPP